jgi:hypothetical protein
MIGDFRCRRLIVISPKRSSSASARPFDDRLTPSMASIPLASLMGFQLHRWGLGFSKSEMRKGLVEGRRRVIAAGWTMSEDETVKGRPFEEVRAEHEKLDQQRKLDQQKKRGK